jgi:hypothetical protein
MAQKTRSTTEETTPQQGNALPPIVHCWCLRLLTEFKREDRLIGKFGFEDDELARQLCLGEFIGSDTGDQKPSLGMRATRCAGGDAGPVAAQFNALCCKRRHRRANITLQPLCPSRRSC